MIFPMKMNITIENILMIQKKNIIKEKILIIKKIIIKTQMNLTI